MIDSPRLRLLVGTHGLRLAGALVVAAALAISAAGWLALAPATETVTQQAHQQEVQTTTATSAVVTAQDSLWPSGTKLRNKPVYLFNATSDMTVTARTEIKGAQQATVDHEWQLTLRAVSDDEVFWTKTETLTSKTHEATTAETATTIDVAELRERVKRQQRKIGSAGVVEAVLTLHVEYDTGQYDGKTAVSAPIEFRGDAYALARTPSDSAQHSTPVRTQVTRPASRSLVFGLGGIGLVLLVGAVGIVYQRPDTIDVGQARDELHRHQYAEWISPGTIPDGLSQAFIELESLEDVVDVAIDTNERVIHDTRRDLFAVISGDVVYYYGVQGNWEETMFPDFELPQSDDPGTPSEHLATDGEGVDDPDDPFDDTGDE